MAKDEPKPDETPVEEEGTELTLGLPEDEQNLLEAPEEGAEPEKSDEAEPEAEPVPPPALVQRLLPKSIADKWNEFKPEDRERILVELAEQIDGDGKDKPEKGEPSKDADGDVRTDLGLPDDYEPQVVDVGPLAERLGLDPSDPEDRPVIAVLQSLAEAAKRGESMAYNVGKLAIQGLRQADGLVNSIETERAWERALTGDKRLGELDDATSERVTGLAYEYCFPEKGTPRTANFTDAFTLALAAVGYKGGTPAPDPKAEQDRDKRGRQAAALGTRQGGRAGRTRKPVVKKLDDLDESYAYHAKQGAAAGDSA